MSLPTTMYFKIIGLRNLNDFLIVSVASEFDKIGQKGYTGWRSKEIGFDTSSFQTLPILDP